ncbi:MAG: hypothetical protein M3Z36_01685 [Acidobacteriota bacterium]|nr:hypothetical protein [Acidobacteriota bacterium]
MKFIVATRDYAGLGFAIRLQDEGHDVILATNADEQTIRAPERLCAFNLVGDGMVPKASLTQSWKNARADGIGIGSGMRITGSLKTNCCVLAAFAF